MNKLIVIKNYQAPYDDPISVSVGDEVVINNEKKTNWRGWVWCTSKLGKSGWVPENYLERHGNIGYLRCDYNAIELTIQVGEILTCHKEESGFIWVTNQIGQQGWIPSTHVELSPTKDK